MDKDYKGAHDWWVRNYNNRTEKSLNVYFAAEAYLKIWALVNAHRGEIGWNMVIKPYKDGYKVYDIVIYPQQVTGGSISVDNSRYGLWKAELPEEQDNNLFGHGHSHVNMPTGASGEDILQQYEETAHKKHGFWLFQIWNKKGDVNSFFYDLDNELFYPNDQINLVIEIGEQTVDEFIEDSYKQLAYVPTVERTEDEPIEEF